MNYDSIKNERLCDQMRHLYGGINISQLAWDLGDYPRDVTEGPIRTVPFSDRKPVDQSLVRRWLKGERPVPAWAERAIARLLTGHLTALKSFLVHSGYGKEMGMDDAYLDALAKVPAFPWFERDQAHRDSLRPAEGEISA